VTASRFTVAVAEAAERDLEDLHHYLTNRGAQDAADRLVDALLTATDTLEEFPRRGSVPSELDAMSEGEVRELLVGLYRFIYVIEGDEVLVFLVMDGRRDVEPNLRRWLGLDQSVRAFDPSRRRTSPSCATVAIRRPSRA